MSCDFLDPPRTKFWISCWEGKWGITRLDGNSGSSRTSIFRSHQVGKGWVNILIFVVLLVFCMSFFWLFPLLSDWETSCIGRPYGCSLLNMCIPCKTAFINQVWMLAVSFDVLIPAGWWSEKQASHAILARVLTLGDWLQIKTLPSRNLKVLCLLFCDTEAGRDSQGKDFKNKQTNIKPLNPVVKWNWHWPMEEWGIP